MMFVLCVTVLWWLREPKTSSQRGFTVSLVWLINKCIRQLEKYVVALLMCVLIWCILKENKQQTACPNESTDMSAEVGWAGGYRLIWLLWSLVCFMGCMKKSLLYYHQVFWASEEVSDGIVVTNTSTLYEQHVMGNLANHETWAGLILIKTTLHKSYLNGTLMTHTSNRRKYSVQCTRDKMCSCQSRVTVAQFSLQEILFKDGTIGQEVQHTHMGDALLRAGVLLYRYRI